MEQTSYPRSLLPAEEWAYWQWWRVKIDSWLGEGVPANLDVAVFRKEVLNSGRSAGSGRTNMI
jgi:hypothetical protein